MTVAFNVEFLKLVHGVECDLNGIFVGLLILLLFLIGSGFGPLAVLLEFDPFFLLLKSYFPKLFENVLLKISTYIFRFVWQTWCTLEATRVFVIILVPMMTICNSNLEMISTFRKIPLCPRLLLWYNYNTFHCVNQMGQTTFSTLAGVLMTLGLNLLVICNALLIVGWDILPLGVFLLIAALCVVVYFCIFETLPIIVKQHNLCNCMIQ